MGANLVILLVLAYGFLRSRMPESLWPQAPDLRGYLMGALVPPLMDLIAMGALALYAATNFRRFKVLLWVFVAAALGSGLLAFLIAETPVIADVGHMQFRQGVVLKKLPGRVLELGDVRGPEFATSSLRLANDEQYRRVPMGIPVEFQVAPHLGVGYVVGVLE